MYCKVALGIDARDVDVIIGDIRKITPSPLEFIESTPDNDYIIYFWDLIDWTGAAVESLLRKLECMRHSLCTVSEEGRLFKDIEISDEWGTDEEFEELLGHRTELTAWVDGEPLEGRQMREAVNIDWETDEEEPSLPKNVLLPDDVHEEDVADYLSDRFGFLVRGFSIASTGGTGPVKPESSSIAIKLPDGKELVAETDPEFREIYVYLKKDGLISQDLAVIGQNYSYPDGRREHSDQYSIKVYADCNSEDYTNTFVVDEYRENE